MLDIFDTFNILYPRENASHGREVRFFMVRPMIL